VLWPDGSTHYIRALAIVERDAAGRAVRMVGTNWDFTERKHAEVALRESEERLEFILATNSIGSWDLDLETQEAHRSLIHDRIFGYDQLLPNWTFELFLSHVLPEDRAGVKRKFESAVAGRHEWDFECRIQRRDGETRWIWATGSHGRNPHGNTRKMSGLVMDITARKQTEAALRENEERFRLMIEGSEQVLFYTHDREHRFNYLSPSTREVLGHEPEELVGQPCDLLVIADDPLNADVHALTDQALQDGKPCPPYPAVVRHKDGRRIVLEILESPIHRDGQVIGIQGFARDITERENARAALAESQRQYRDLVETSHNVIWSVDLEGRFTFINQASLVVFGREPGEMVGHRYHEFIPEDQQRANDEVMAQMLRDGQDAINYTNRIRRKDGSIAILNSNARVVRDPQGRVIGISGMSQDTTEVVRAQEAIAQSEARFRGLFEQAAVGMCLASTEGNFLRTNARFCEIIGYSAEELLLRDCIQTTHPDDRGHEAETVSGMLAGERQTATWEKRYLRKDGQVVWCNLTLSLLPAAEGLAPQFVGVIEDITERKQAEELLAASENRLRLALEAAQLGTFDWDSPGNRLVWSRRHEELWGYGPGEFDGTYEGFARRVHPEDLPVVQAAIALCQATRAKFAREFRVVWPDGSVHWVNGMGEFLFDDEGRAVRMNGAVMDITEHKEAVLAVQRSEERFRELAENIREVFWMTDPAKNQMLYISPAYEKIWGRTCASLYESPRQWLDAIHPDDRARVIEAVATKQSRGDYDVEYRIQRPDGTVRWIHDRAFPVCDALGKVLRIVGTAEDVTERRQQESLAQRSQRLESIGTLAGGIAHDLNNALAPIMLSGELLRLQYPDESEVLDMIENGSKRAADMVRQLLAFAKGAAGERVSVQPGRLVRELEKLMKGSFPKNIQLVVKGDAQLPTVLGDATQLHQVLLNLCVNARDAMPHGGTLTLEAQHLDVDAAYASAVPDARPRSLT
jgi:PAS domain S-box-containing protein